MPRKTIAGLEAEIARLKKVVEDQRASINAQHEQQQNHAVQSEKVLDKLHDVEKLLGQLENYTSELFKHATALEGENAAAWKAYKYVVKKACVSQR